jgi:hypothetical protein
MHVVITLGNGRCRRIDMRATAGPPVDSVVVAADLLHQRPRWRLLAATLGGRAPGYTSLGFPDPGESSNAECNAREAVIANAGARMPTVMADRELCPSVLPPPECSGAGKPPHIGMTWV